MPAYIHAIETIVPPYVYKKDFAKNHTIALVADTEAKKKFITRIYDHSGIDQRHSVIEDHLLEPSEHIFYPKNSRLEPEPGTEARNNLYAKWANDLTLKVVAELLKNHAIERSEITHLITASCTGFQTPGIDFHILQTLGLNSSTRRYHIGFMGCFAAFPVMQMARTILAAEPRAKVLAVNCEICTVHFKKKFDPEIQVANALFADGVSAALITGEARGPSIALESFHSDIAPSSENEMAWTIGDHGFNMRLSAYVPSVIEKNMEDQIFKLLNKAGIKKEDLRLWAIHPGGRAILDKFASSLNIEKKELSTSYDVLREYGNMSSATVMFVLKRILEDRSEGKVFSAAFGPGLTIESAILEKSL